MPINIAVSGTNRNINSVNVAVSNTNRSVTKAYVAVSNTNREIFTNKITASDISQIRLVPEYIQYGTNNSSGTITSTNYLYIYGSSYLSQLSSTYGSVSISGNYLYSYGSSSYTGYYNILVCALYIYTKSGTMVPLYTAYTSGQISSCTIYSQGYYPSASSSNTFYYWHYSYTSTYNTITYGGSWYSFSNYPQSNTGVEVGIAVATSAGRGWHCCNRLYQVNVNGSSFTPVVYYQ